MAYKHCFNQFVFFLLLLFLQWPLYLAAQSKSSVFSWHISARAAGKSSGYDIHIDQDKDKIHFTFKRLDSLRQHDMEKDPAYIEQRAAVKASTTVDEVTYQIEKLASIIEIFEVYQKDTLSYSTPLPAPSLKSFLDSISNLPVEIMTNNKSSKTDKQLSDGYSFHFTRMNGKKKTADFYTALPSANSYPLLFRLVMLTLAFYQNQKADAIITTAFTKMR